MGSIVAAAEQLAATLKAAGVNATHDPDRADAIRPCVLVAPPAIDYSARSNTYRLACLSAKPIGSLAALSELDQLVQQLQTVPGVYPERADPASYVLAPDRPAVPAYLVTITT